MLPIYESIKRHVRASCTLEFIGLPDSSASLKNQKLTKKVRRAVGSAS